MRTFTFYFPSYLALWILLIDASIPRQSSAQEPEVKRIVLSHFEKPLDADWARDASGVDSPFELETSSEKVKEGISSGRWDPSRRPWIFLKKCPQDWSQYQAIRVWIYAQESNGQRINFWINSDGESAWISDKPRSYYFHQIKVDWTGWKQVVISFNQCQAVRSPQGWDQISSLMISSKGGNAEPLAGNILWWDEMELVGL